MAVRSRAIELETLAHAVAAMLTYQVRSSAREDASIADALFIVAPNAHHKDTAQLLTAASATWAAMDQLRENGARAW